MKWLCGILDLWPRGAPAAQYLHLGSVCPAVDTVDDAVHALHRFAGLADSTPKGGPRRENPTARELATGHGAQDPQIVSTIAAAVFKIVLVIRSTIMRHDARKVPNLDVAGALVAKVKTTLHKVAPRRIDIVAVPGVDVAIVSLSLIHI